MLHTINELLWGPGTLALLLGSGIFLTTRMRFLPWRRLGAALRFALGRESRQTGRHGVSPFSALMTALAATIGTGNIAGVATALVAGGPGALVWMELSALFGMATIFTESLLSVKYRRRNRRGLWVGGPMYVLEACFGSRLGRGLGCLFALFAVAASFGIGGMTQANAISDSLQSAFALSPRPVGAAAAILALAVMLGGTRAVSRTAAVLVPAMTLFYLGAGFAVMRMNLDHLLPGLLSIFHDAFSPEAIAGGAVGEALRWGVARGVFSNEAGLGSSGIAAGSADAENAVKQGYINMTGVFFDTFVLCTVTGLVLCCSGVLESPGSLNGTALVLRAFETALGPWGVRLLSLSVVLFAFSTILGWGYLGEIAFSYLTRERHLLLYRALYVLAIFWGAGQSVETVYLLSDLCCALMCMPNLLCLLLKHGEAVQEICRLDSQQFPRNSCIFRIK